MKRMLAVFLSWFLACSFATAEDQVVDISGVTKIRITGEASGIDIKAADGAPYKAYVGALKDGHPVTSCGASHSAQVIDHTLFIETRHHRDARDCVTHIRVDVAKGANISIEQATFNAVLEGDFSTVAVTGASAEISFSGYAQRLDVNGQATKLDVSLGPSRGGETVTVDSTTLDARINVTPGTPVRYSVQDSLSRVESSLPNSPDARTVFDIRGRAVQLVIR